MTRRDLLGEPAGEDADKIMAGPKVSALLSGQRDDGAFAGGPTVIRRYRGNSRRPEEVIGIDYVPAGPAGHWKSTQWRLVALVELAIPPDEPRVVAAANYVLDANVDRRPSNHQRAATHMRERGGSRIGHRLSAGDGR